MVSRIVIFCVPQMYRYIYHFSTPNIHRANGLYDYVIHGRALAGLNCTGTESDITDCRPVHMWGISDCNSPDYVGINCSE